MASIVTANLVERLLGWALPVPVRSSGAVLIVSNLVPLYGVLAWDWPMFHVMVLYWAENVLAGVFTLLRMLRAHLLGGLLLGAFFCVHYGMFCFVHGGFVNVLFNPAQTGGFGLAPLLFAMVTQPTLTAAAVLLAASHGWSFIAHALLAPTGAHHLGHLMQRPYLRMAALHAGIIFGGWAILSLDSPVLALVPLIVIKTAVDLALHNRANLPRADTPVPEPAA